MTEVFTEFVNIVYNIVTFLFSLPLFAGGPMGDVSFGAFFVVSSILFIVLGFVLRAVVVKRSVS